MNNDQFFHELGARIANYDLLCHPFYRAWAAGELTREDLLAYARDYYHHVAAFPRYLRELANRLDEGELRNSVLANLADEQGLRDVGHADRPHSELWLDFVQGLGGDRSLEAFSPLPEMRNLIAFFERIAQEGSGEESLAAFYAYESQVPRIAKEKARGLREKYGADEATCAYFTLHETADIYHSEVWRQQLDRLLNMHPEAREKALDAAETAAIMLWRALDGIEARRNVHAAA
jgi:pyrroloquinoline-quinone synthase